MPPGFCRRPDCWESETKRRRGRYLAAFLRPRNGPKFGCRFFIQVCGTCALEKQHVLASPRSSRCQAKPAPPCTGGGEKLPGPANLLRGFCIRRFPGNIARKHISNTDASNMVMFGPPDRYPRSFPALRLSGQRRIQISSALVLITSPPGLAEAAAAGDSVPLPVPPCHVCGTPSRWSLGRPPQSVMAASARGDRRQSAGMRVEARKKMAAGGRTMTPRPYSET